MAKKKMPPQLLEYFKNKNKKKEDGKKMSDKEKRKEALDKANKVKDKKEVNLENYKKEILKETKSDIENTMNERVAQFKKNFIEEFLSEQEADDSVRKKSDKPVDGIHSSMDVTRIVREALTKYDADKTGLFDFALESAGGSIVTTKCTEPYQMTSAVMSVWGVPFWWDTNSPRSALRKKLFN